MTVPVPDAIAVLDGIGTLAFALSGALLGVRKQFDLFGVLFLGFVAAVAGGLMRDVLMGDLPPAAITHVHYFLIAIGGGLLTFFWHPAVASRQREILLFDAVGLALFAVVGTEKALAHGIHPLMAALLGMLSGIGGGMTRDVLAGEVPFVLRGDLYALAALAGGSIVAGAHVLAITPFCALLAGAAACLFLRLMAIYRNWRAPLPRMRG
jgi:uncharacterized membrane protein YeiH